MSKNQIILILENIRSTHNVGSIFRTADAVGVEKIYLVGVTPDPIDRFGREQKDISKTALGAEKNVPWEHASEIFSLIQNLKNSGYSIVALEQNAKSVNEIPKSENKIALILGEETKGITADVLQEVDYIFELRMKGKKESLNVSVATGIALYKLTGLI